MFCGSQHPGCLLFKFEGCLFAFPSILPSTNRVLRFPYVNTCACVCAHGTRQGCQGGMEEEEAEVGSLGGREAVFLRHSFPEFDKAAWGGLLSRGQEEANLFTHLCQECGGR
jgi:hypothetical protein